jgi:hypothetical protein
MKPLGDVSSKEEIMKSFQNTTISSKIKSPFINNKGEYKPYHGNEFEQWHTIMMSKVKVSAKSKDLSD